MSFDDVFAEARVLASATVSWRRGGRLPPVAVDIALGEARVVGNLGEIWPAAQLRHTFSRVKGKTELSLWIRHLCLMQAWRDGQPRQSVLCARGKDGSGIEVRRFPPLDRDEAARRLRELCELYRLGQSQPLAFFPESALEYVDTLIASGGDEEARADALRAATKRFESEKTFGESLDVYVARIFGGQSPISETAAPFGDSSTPSFAELALAVMGPVVAHLETELLA